RVRSIWRRASGHFRDRLFRCSHGLDLHCGQHPIQLAKNFVAVYWLDGGCALIRDAFRDGFETQREFVAASVLKDVIELHVSLIVLLSLEAFHGAELGGANFCRRGGDRISLWVISFWKRELLAFRGSQLGVHADIKERCIEIGPSV